MFQVQTSKTPQITFGIKHSPLLGQLKPINTSRPEEKTSTLHTEQSRNQINRQKVDDHNVTDSTSITETSRNHIIRQTVDDNTEQIKDRYSRQDAYDAESINDIQSRSHYTHLRPDSELRSATLSPEPLQTTDTLAQEIVWVPENTQVVRRGSYTIDNADGNGYSERYHNSEVVPLENGVIRTAQSGERGANCTENTSMEVIRGNGFEQNVDRHVKNSSAREKTQTASEEVRTGSEVEHLANGGISKTTTTTTVRKVGTAAKTANATTSVTRTTTAVTSRDIGVK